VVRVAAAPLILIGADIVSVPTVERAFPDAGDVVAGNIVAQVVALIVRAPEIAVGADGETHAIANSRCEHGAVLAAGRKLQEIGAIGFDTPGGTALGYEHVAIGSDAYQTRAFEPRREQAHLESRRHRRLFSVGARRHLHLVCAVPCGRPAADRPA
jgi:hypothetical protein